MCSPTRASILSGRHVIHTGVYTPFAQGTALRLSLNFSLLPQHLSSLGYKTHMVGKWHIGQNELAALPTGRGFDSSYGYWSGAETYYSHEASGAYDFAEGTQTCAAANGSYSTNLFAERAVRIVLAHEFKTSPLFLYLAFQAIHWPLEVDASHKKRFDNTTGGSSRRQSVAAMATVLDEGVGNVTRALKQAGQWERALVIFVSDNGGPTHGDEETNSNNYPMRGGKNTLWEGGTRVVACARGAGISPHLVGIFFFFLSLTSYNSHHNSRAQSREKCRRRGASSGQKTRRGIEGEDPATAGIERFFSRKGPREKNNVSFLKYVGGGDGEHLQGLREGHVLRTTERALSSYSHLSSCYLYI